MDDGAGTLPPINWGIALLFGLTFAGAVTVVPWYGLTHGYSGWAWAWCFLLLGANGMSITAGYHRLWAHRTYRAHGFLRFMFMIFGGMALQNSILIWATDHRRHHQHVDRDDQDPYSAGRGFWYSHIGWMLRYWQTGRNDFSNGRDLMEDPLVTWQHRHYVALALVTNIGLPLLLGWLHGDLWGVFLLAGLLRLVLIHHTTFLINSLAHMWGSRPYTDTNSARDNGWLAFLTYGEGYHNFHHIFDRDYRNGVRWWQWDPSKWLIFAASKVGLASQLRRVPDVTIHKARVAMQLKRVEAAVTCPRRARHLPDLDRLRAHLTAEMAAFQGTLAEWSRVREERMASTRERLLARWEEARFRDRTREIERTLKVQCRRLSRLAAELPAPLPQPA